MEELIVLQPIHKDLLLQFERIQLGENPSFEVEMKSWDARWRPEALDHYLSLGWSFALLKDGKVSSYILAQPFVFFRGLTQTLWIEWIGAESQSNASQIIDVAYRWARDKHFQTLVLDENQSFSKYAYDSSFPFEKKDGLLSLKTSKMK